MKNCHHHFLDSEFEKLFFTFSPIKNRCPKEQNRVVQPACLLGSHQNSSVYSLSIFRNSNFRFLWVHIWTEEFNRLSLPGKLKMMVGLRTFNSSKKSNSQLFWRPTVWAYIKLSNIEFSKRKKIEIEADDRQISAEYWIIFLY